MLAFPFKERGFGHEELREGPAVNTVEEIGNKQDEGEVQASIN